jgi:hypothetical protein
MAQLEKETEEVFSSKEKKRQAARYKKLVEAEAKIQKELEAEMKEREELRRERAKNRAKLSSSSISALPTTKRNIGFSYGIGPDDIPNEGEDIVLKYHNWNEFQEKLDDLEERKAELRQVAREARVDGKPTVKNPYPAESMKNLAYIVGLKNR